MSNHEENLTGRIPFGFSEKTLRRKTARIQVDSANCEQWVYLIVISTQSDKCSQHWIFNRQSCTISEGKNKEVTGSNQEPRD